MTFRAMSIEDVHLLKLEEEWMYDRFINYFECHTGPAYVFEEDGRVLCAFGALFEWGPGGACEVWFNLIANRRTFEIARRIKRMIHRLAEQYQITRMQAIVRSDSEVNNRFMRFLGFVNETPNGMKNKLHDNGTAYLYARYF